MKRLLFVASALALAASLLAMAAVVHQQRVRSFGKVIGLPDPGLRHRPASIVGINVALEQYDDLASILQSLRGFAWLRQAFPWQAIEPAPGEYEWAAWDEIVFASRQSGHRLIAVLGHAPDWARAPGSPPGAPPASAEAFGAFARRVAERYSGDISVYQIWDEPNLAIGWGGEPSAAGYAALLQAGYAGVKSADPAAIVLAAALAPTLETGPDNISDVLYLQQLYDLGAAAWFDAAAGKPYGFYTGPEDRLADPAILNFSRFALLRQVMVRNGDGHKLLWAGNFGWNSMASPWGQSTPEQQLSYTLSAFDRARHEWPWAGVLALESYQPGPGAEPARWGFALVNQRQQHGELLAAITARFAGPQPAVPGNYGAQHPAASYSGDWQLSDVGADIPQAYQSARLAFTFEGSNLGLVVRRGDYRGHLYVEVNGQAANLLPRDEHGAYLVLTSPELVPEVTQIAVASGLPLDRTHTAVIRPERGWGQWALAGFSVGRRESSLAFGLWMAGLVAVALAAAANMWRLRRAAGWPELASRFRCAWRRLGDRGQLALTAATGGLLYLTSWLTWGSDLANVTRRFGDALPIAVTALTAGLFYFSPSLLLALAALAMLAVLFYLRLDLALAFVALVIPFYLQYRLLWQRGFALTEVFTLLALAAWLLHTARPALERAAGRDSGRHAAARWWAGLSLADWAVLAFLAVSTLSTLGAGLLPVALREFRLALLEPVLFYWVLRHVRLDRRALWRIIDFFILGAVAVAAIGLAQAVTGADLITAEGGVARIRSVYGSPNNLALYLGRALPLAAAVALMSRPGIRRLAYAAASIVLAVAILLTFSRGALLLGVPAGLAVVLVAWQPRRGLALIGAAALAGLAALPVLLRLPRFAGLLDLAGGTSFFRTRLWLSAWRMFLDHPWLGVGPDNFLYQYRSRYILPEAWQEPNLSHPHNLALDFLTRLGIFGLAVGLWLLAAFWRSALITYRRLAQPPAGEPTERRLVRRELLALTAGLMGLVAAMLAHGLVDHGFFLVDLAFAFFLALAAVQHVQRLADAATAAA
jgi:O-antigen ligase